MTVPNKSLRFTLVLLSTILIIYILIVGKALIIPFIVALLIWQLMNTIASGIKRLPLIGQYLPQWLCMIMGVAFFGLLVWGVLTIISDNVTAVMDAMPWYQTRLSQLMNSVKIFAHLQPLSLSGQWLQQLNLQNILLNVSAVFTSLTGNAILIFLYIIFLFLEQKVLTNKTRAFFSRTSSREVTTNLVKYIVKDTQIYMGIKILTSFLTATLSWLIMWWVGLDFSEFWALLIFFLNFIPNIGAITATIFPAILAIIQFTAWSPFLIITLGISIIQFIIGNVVEPRLMGYSLNLSPLVILIALVFWGALWGFIGMFLSVPITVTLMIVFSHFEKTRKIAVLLSRDGTLKKRI